jgi:hypothetical protein
MHHWSILRSVAAIALAIIFTFPPNAAAETHIVNGADLQAALVSSARMREQNLAQVKGFLGSPLARKALKDAHLDPVQVTNAVATLSNGELAEIAARTQKAQNDYAAGSLSDHAVVLLVVAIAVVVIIILAVKL